MLELPISGFLTQLPDYKYHPGAFAYLLRMQIEFSIISFIGVVELIYYFFIHLFILSAYYSSFVYLWFVFINKKKLHC